MSRILSWPRSLALMNQDGKYGCTETRLVPARTLILYYAASKNWDMAIKMDMAIKINFVLFERTFKAKYKELLKLYFDQKQCAVHHLGIIIDLIN